VYIVYPLVEESEKLDLKAATEAYDLLISGPFKELKVGLLHGRMKTVEKEEILLILMRCIIFCKIDKMYVGGLHALNHCGSIP